MSVTILKHNKNKSDFKIGEATWQNIFLVRSKSELWNLS